MNFLKGENIHEIIQRTNLEMKEFKLREKIEEINTYWNQNKLGFYKLFKHLETIIDADPIININDSKLSNLNGIVCSKIINSKVEFQTLQSFFDKRIMKGLKLLYRASEHNFSTKKFYDLCDNIPNTLVLAKTEK